ncbi:hypothetical protein [Roseibacillus persicicus]|uniref:hypothetical protein n=1 Tax=Roseibacillus persicicus TaxID=454148 RepID=UPI00280D42BF|nr:hypothetical protein [Roseibacillus persicicus]MDQ8192508.1 hypothetical protein [Roseibacillus persicicus]
MNSRRHFLVLGSATAAYLALPSKIGGTSSPSIQAGKMKSFSITRETSTQIEARVAFSDFQQHLAKNQEITPSRMKANGNKLSYEEAGKTVILTLCV